MKKSMVSLAAIALVLASCSKNEVANNLTQESAIGFGTFSYTMTKAAVAMDNSDIKLYGINQDASDATTNWFFNGQKLEYVSAANNKASYTYSPLRYWPTTQTNGFDFYAYAPYASTAAVVTLNSPADLGNTLTYTVPTNADEDFRMAKHTRVKRADLSSATATLTFDHMLSKVTIGKFEFQNVLPGYTASVTKVELKDLYNKATRTFSAATNGLGSEWAVDNTPSQVASYEVTGTPVAENSALYIMPQTFPTNAKLVFTITLTGDASVGSTTDNIEVEVDLTDANKTDWQKAEMATNYKLNLELDANKNFEVIKFEAEVNDWKNPATDVKIPVVEPTAQKLNSIVNNTTLAIGGTATTLTLPLTTDLTWDWSTAAHTFNGLANTGESFKLTFAKVDFGANNNKITITVPTGFKINLATGSADQQTVEVIANTNEVTIEKK